MHGNTGQDTREVIMGPLRLSAVLTTAPYLRDLNRTLPDSESNPTTAFANL
jgi:hypothetical protein